MGSAMAPVSDPGGERCLAGDGDDAVVVKGIVGQRPQPRNGSTKPVDQRPRSPRAEQVSQGRCPMRGPRARAAARRGRRRHAPVSLPAAGLSPPGCRSPRRRCRTSSCKRSVVAASAEWATTAGATGRPSRQRRKPADIRDARLRGGQMDCVQRQRRPDRHTRDERILKETVMAPPDIELTYLLL